MLACGQNNVYLEPGAFVNGGFRTSCDGGVFDGPEAVLFSGRGILSGETFPWRDPRFVYGLLNIDRGRGNVVDGLMLVDSPEYYLRAYSAGAPIIRNVKMLASWPYNSDGFDVGVSALVEDVFIRANDDCVKLPGASGSVVQRVVIWQMLNGASFQLGWNSRVSAQSVAIRDVDVIHVDYCQNAQPGSGGSGCSVSSSSNNNGFLVLSPSSSAASLSVSGIAFTRVRIEADVGRLVYVLATSGTSGSVNDVTLAGLTVAADSAPQGAVNVIGGASGASATFARWTFANVSVDGQCLRSASDAGMTVAAGVSGLQFQC